MNDVRAEARVRGVAIELADLGDWGDAAAVAEYDPRGPLVRLNLRELPVGPPAAVRAHVDRAVAHELYHHAEATGRIPRRPTYREREGAARAAEDRAEW